jgi:hypothetical protein
MSVPQSDDPIPHTGGGVGASASWQLIATDAIRYWEPRRLAFNVVLLAIVVRQAVHVWPASRNALDVPTGVAFFALATAANLLYCAAYPIDVFVQMSAYREAWRQRRGVLFVLGLALAGLLTYFWAGLMIPGVSD